MKTSGRAGAFLLIGSTALLFASDPPKKSASFAGSIPYELGEKTAAVRDAEGAIDRHPMVSAALRATVEAHKYCRLASFDFKARSEDEVKGTQFNGGELRLEFVYFCFRHTKAQIEAAYRNYEGWERQQPGSDWLGEPDQADVVLTISGDYSRKQKKLFDPTVGYSACYAHSCGSN